jgi:hypothetical protein
VKRVPYLLVNLYFPPHKGGEVGKKTLEVLQKYKEDPTIAKWVLRGAVMRTQHGIRSMNVSEVPVGKLEAAIDRANEMVDMFSEIEGVNAEFFTMATMAEALEMIGLKMP